MKGAFQNLVLYCTLPTFKGWSFKFEMKLLKVGAPGYFEMPIKNAAI